MSRQKKLIQKLLSNPKDFTWDELSRLLALYGYREQKTGKTSGSRRKFINNEGKLISLHKPHPGNIVKEYLVKELIIYLSTNEHLKDE